MTTPHIVAIYGSPRRKGNTAILLDRAVQGVQDAGVIAHKIVLRDLNISPCLEIYGCMRDGHCVIKDDFHGAVETILAAQGIMLASPIFFYTVSAHTKIFMDRCQSLWARKYRLKQSTLQPGQIPRKALFISVGATRGKRLFDGALLTMRYFLDALDGEIWQSLLYRQIDLAGDILKHPEYLEEAYTSGRQLAEMI